MKGSTHLVRPGIVFSNEQVANVPASDGVDVASSFSPIGYGYDRKDDQVSHLRDYWRIIRKRLWLVMGLNLLIPTLVAIYLIRRPDIYESQARVQVDLETANSNSLLGGMSKNSPVILSNDQNDPAYFNTQLQILVGPGLLRRVVKNLDLEHNPDFAGAQAPNKSVWTSLRTLFGLDAGGAKGKTPANIPVSAPATSSGKEMLEAEQLSEYVDELQATLRVEPVKENRLTVRETRLIDISYRHTDPRLAAKIVNTLAETFELQNLEKKTLTSSSTGTYLQQRIAELQTIIRKKEEELINYAKNNQILSLDGKENTVVERLEGLNKQLLTAENERKMTEAAYRSSLQPGAAEALAEGGATEMVPSATRVTTDAELELAKLKQKRAELLVENTEKWPEVKEVDKQIAVREKQLNETRNRAKNIVTTNLATRYRQALQTEESLRKAYNAQRAETLTQNEAAVSYRIIKQEIETNQALLEGLLQRTKENDVVMAGTPNNIRVVDFAIAGKKPVAPRRTLIVALSVLVSLGVGIALAFFIEYLDDSVRSTEDVENFLHLPSIAVIPQVGVVKPRRFFRSGKDGAIATIGSSNQLLLSEMEKRSPIAEAYRHLRTSILLSTAGRPPKTLLITSSVPAEGKTTTVVNTAISLAQTGAKVLIIDADMRRPRLQSIFHLKNDHGLSSLLSRDAADSDISSAIQLDPDTGLFIMTAGPVPPNPAELIGSEQMLKLIAAASVDFNHVIIDSPPVAAFTDGVLIASMVDGVLLVVHSGRGSRKIVARARKLLQDVGARIIGVVLNKVEASGAHSYYYYSGYYHNYETDGKATEDVRGVGANG